MVAVAAPLIIPIVFGDGWAQSGQVAQILALAGILVVGATLDHGLFYGLGKPGRWFVYARHHRRVHRRHHGDHRAVGAGGRRLRLPRSSPLVATVSRWFLVARLLEASPRTLAGPFGFLAAAVLAGGGAGWVVLVLSTRLHPIVRIALIGLAVLLTHIVVVRLLARSVIDELASYLPRFRRANRIRILPKPKERS